VDYVANLEDPGRAGRSLSTCELHLVTGHGPWEDKRPDLPPWPRFSLPKGVPCSLDDWGSMGGHDWPYWKHQMREYLSRW